MIIELLVIALVVLVVTKYCNKLMVHIGYYIMLKIENRRRKRLGIEELKYDLPFYKEDEKEE